VIVSNNVAYVIDCGDGVARQLALAGVPLPTLRHVFITHHHSDHNADYGNLIWLAWAAGLRTRVDTWGPPPLEKMTKLFFEMNAYDIDTRISNEGRVPIAPLVHVHEIRDGGVVMSDDNVKVTAALVDHPPVVPAFAYRFDARDRSIVISGDTAPSENLVKLARGADVHAASSAGQTPLHPAASGSPKCVRMLLAAGAKVDAADRIGRTPLAWAASNNNVETAKLLLDAGADPNREDNEGGSPYAAAYDNKPQVKALLEAHGGRLSVKQIANRARLRLMYPSLFLTR